MAQVISVQRGSVSIPFTQNVDLFTTSAENVSTRCIVGYVTWTGPSQSGTGIYASIFQSFSGANNPIGLLSRNSNFTSTIVSIIPTEEQYSSSAAFTGGQPLVYLESQTSQPEIIGNLNSSVGYMPKDFYIGPSVTVSVNTSISQSNTLNYCFILIRET